MSREQGHIVQTAPDWRPNVTQVIGPQQLKPTEATAPEAPPAVELDPLPSDDLAPLADVPAKLAQPNSVYRISLADTMRVSISLGSGHIEVNCADHGPHWDDARNRLHRVRLDITNELDAENDRLLASKAGQIVAQAAQDLADLDVRLADLERQAQEKREQAEAALLEDRPHLPLRRESEDLRADAAVLREKRRPELAEILRVRRQQFGNLQSQRFGRIMARLAAELEARREALASEILDVLRRNLAESQVCMAKLLELVSLRRSGVRMPMPGAAPADEFDLD